MPTAIKSEVKANVIKDWLLDDTRNEIATNNASGIGTISNVIDGGKKELAEKGSESVCKLVFKNTRIKPRK
jgi:hypothetical protein